MVNVYLKGVRKQWLIGIAVPLSVAIFIPLIASIWPDMKAQAEAWAEFLKNPIYKAFLGDVANLSTWAGFFNMYIFIWLEWIIMFVAIFVPAWNWITQHYIEGVFIYFIADYSSWNENRYEHYNPF